MATTTEAGSDVTALSPARRSRGVAWDLLRLARPGQWPKNVLVVSVPLLDLPSWSLAVVPRLAWAVAAFTLASILVYVLNDLMDRGRDAANPSKWDRPLASGRLPVPAAVVFAAGVAVLLAVMLAMQPLSWVWPIGTYLLLNLGYSLGLKHVALLDVFFVAAGFGLRVMLGYLALGINVSVWLLTCVFSLCLLLTMGKRRQELLVSGGGHRPALRGYTVGLADQLMLLTAVLTTACYLLYVRTEAPLGQHAALAAVLTGPLAPFGLFRYLQLVVVQGSGENPVRTLLRDPALVINAVLWAAISTTFLAIAE